MSERVPTWPRPNWHQSNGLPSRQHYIAFFADECPDVAVSANEDGLPEGDPLAGFQLEAFDDRAWITGWSAGSLAAFLANEPSVDGDAVRRSRAAMGAWYGKPDPRTLAALQGGMALARAFARAGAVAVLDVVALRWWSPADLLALAPDRPFDLREHVTSTFETRPEHPEVGHFCHTRGLAKFARPDLGLHVPTPKEAAAAGARLSAVATALALGLDPADGATLRLSEGEVLRCKTHPDDSGTASPLFFNRWLELIAAR